MASLGKLIRARRKELGLTQQQLGGREITKGFISLIESDRGHPSVETLVLLADRLLREPEMVAWLRGDDDDDEPHRAA